MQRAWIAALVVCGLGACAPATQDAGAPTAVGNAATGDAARQQTPAASPARTPAPAPAAPAQDLPATQSRLDGFGPLQFGMTLAEAAQAWPGLLDASQLARGNACFSANLPAQVEVPYTAVMFDDGKFVRYESSNDTLQAPGGGQRGMTQAQLQQSYADALQPSPHRFVEGGHYLSLDASGVAPSRLVFETDASGKATEWRVGLSPQVDYTEACESDPG